jgi:hypothetical protein
MCSSHSSPKMNVSYISRNTERISTKCGIADCTMKVSSKFIFRSYWSNMSRTRCKPQLEYYRFFSNRSQHKSRHIMNNISRSGGYFTDNTFLHLSMQSNHNKVPWDCWNTVLHALVAESTHSAGRRISQQESFSHQPSCSWKMRIQNSFLKPVFSIL